MGLPTRLVNLPFINSLSWASSLAWILCVGLKSSVTSNINRFSADTRAPTWAESRQINWRFRGRSIKLAVFSSYTFSENVVSFFLSLLALSLLSLKLECCAMVSLSNRSLTYNLKPRSCEAIDLITFLLCMAPYMGGKMLSTSE